jgi:hypothetical protein
VGVGKCMYFLAAIRMDICWRALAASVFARVTRLPLRDFGFFRGGRSELDFGGFGGLIPVKI